MSEKQGYAILLISNPGFNHKPCWCCGDLRGEDIHGIVGYPAVYQDINMAHSQLHSLERNKGSIYRVVEWPYIPNGELDVKNI